MDKLAGDDQVLVQKFSVHGKAVDLEMKSEGNLDAPQLSTGEPKIPQPIRARG